MSIASIARDMEEWDALRPTRFVAIDFETATADRSSACSLGLVAVENGQPFAERIWLLRPPGNRYESRNTAVHGLTAYDTRDAPLLSDIWGEVAPWLEWAPLLVAHNAGFDVGVLRATLADQGESCPSIEYGCTLSLARKALPDLPNHKLNTLAERYGVPLVHHEALSDARACAAIGLGIGGELGQGAMLPSAFHRLKVKLRRV